MAEHKEDCLSINSKKSVKVKEGTIKKYCSEYEKYSEQIPVPFKIYADFECNLEGVEGYEDSYTQKISRFLVVSLTKLFGLMIDLASQLLFLEVKRLLMDILKQFLRSMCTAKSL